MAYSLMHENPLCGGGSSFCLEVGHSIESIPRLLGVKDAFPSREEYPSLSMDRGGY